MVALCSELPRFCGRGNLTFVVYELRVDKRSELRHATIAELDEARKIVRGWVKAFADDL